MDRFIVAEVSKNWIDGQEVIPSGPICRLFEKVIATNHQRGYRLLSFQLNRMIVAPRELNETIIAVFEHIG